MRKWWVSPWMQQLIFTGPAAAVYAIIIAVPVVLCIYYSFTSWNGISGQVTWVGLDNYKKILSADKQFYSSFWFTFRYMLAVLVFTNALGFAFAYLLSKPLKSRNVLRTLLFMPNVLGGLLLGFIWQFIFVQGFATLGKMTDLAFFNLQWLGTATTSYWALVIVSIWQGAGYLMVIYIAGLTNVPADLLQAAEIDGAKSWQILRHIILPLIMPAITVCLFLTISWAFKSFDLNFSLTKGGPFRSSESISMNIYNEAFQNNNYGLGTTKAFIFFIVVMIVTSIQVAVTKKKEVEM
ncbi:carbohydrate ABC transporter permease [Paenibacillus sp. GCM10027628]|uniref:carbohydrate ABC transporter permease n=1 Tax=Paenibacillus sp. GCM10027628 TaxID=3273413 RepID=UPI00362F30D2